MYICGMAKESAQSVRARCVRTIHARHVRPQWSLTAVLWGLCGSYTRNRPLITRQKTSISIRITRCPKFRAQRQQHQHQPCVRGGGAESAQFHHYTHYFCLDVRAFRTTYSRDLCAHAKWREPRHSREQRAAAGSRVCQILLCLA